MSTFAGAAARSVPAGHPASGTGLVDSTAEPWPAVNGAPWLIVSAAFVETGGQDRANFALATALAAHQAEVHLVAHTTASSFDRHPTIVRHLAPRPFGADLLGEPFLQRLGSKTAGQLGPRAAHVIVNGGNCDWPDVNWVHYVHAAYDRTGENSMMRRVRLRIANRRWLSDERRALGRAKLIIANSHKTRRDLIDTVGVSEDRIRVIYYGVDSDEFRPPLPGEREAMRERLGWPTSRPVVMFVGALGDRRKGFDTVLDAWSTLARPSKLKPLLVVIGRGAQLRHWQTRVEQTGLTDSVTFLGFRADVPAIMRAADALVSPTRYEAYGLGVHEALCCGLPAIVSADAGVAERYPSRLSDLLLPDANDASDLAQRLDRSLCDAALPSRVSMFAEALRARRWDDMSREIVAAVCERS